MAVPAQTQKGRAQHEEAHAKFVTSSWCVKSQKLQADCMQVAQQTGCASHAPQPYMQTKRPGITERVCQLHVLCVEAGQLTCAVQGAAPWPSLP